MSSQKKKTLRVKSDEKVQDTEEIKYRYKYLMGQKNTLPDHQDKTDPLGIYIYTKMNRKSLMVLKNTLADT